MPSPLGIIKGVYFHYRKFLMSNPGSYTVENSAEYYVDAMNERNKARYLEHWQQARKLKEGVASTEMNNRL